MIAGSFPLIPKIGSPFGIFPLCAIKGALSLSRALGSSVPQTARRSWCKPHCCAARHTNRQMRKDSFSVAQAPSFHLRSIPPPGMGRIRSAGSHESSLELQSNLLNGSRDNGSILSLVQGLVRPMLVIGSIRSLVQNLASPIAELLSRMTVPQVLKKQKISWNCPEAGSDDFKFAEIRPTLASLCPVRARAASAPRPSVSPSLPRADLYMHAGAAAKPNGRAAASAAPVGRSVLLRQ